MVRRDLLTVDDLWAMPRVGDPIAAGTDEAVILPVTQYSMDENVGFTRLWWVPLPIDGGRASKAEPPRALTAPDMNASMATVSPDGRRLAFIRKAPEAAKKDAPKADWAGQLHILDLRGGEAERVTDMPLGVEDIAWFSDSHRIAFIGTVFRDALTLDAARERVLETRESKVKAHVTEDRVYRAWDHWVTDEKVHHVYVLDTGTGDVRDLTPRFRQWSELIGFGRCLAISPDGREIAFHANLTDPPHHEMRRGVYIVRVPKKSLKIAPPRLLTEAAAANATSPQYSADGKYLYYAMNREVDFYADRMRLAVYDRKKRSHTVLTEAFDRSINSFHIDDDGRRAVLAADHHARTAYFELDLRAAHRSPKKTEPTEIVRGGTLGRPVPVGESLAYTRSTLSEAPELFVSTPGSKRPRRVTTFTQDVLSQRKMGEVEEFIFDGARGDAVQMFVVHPPQSSFNDGRPTRRRPLVHLIHGGPHSAFGDGWHWRWSAQAFAAQGYAVALVNFHGSTSWGQEFAQSIHGAWGEMPYEDVMRATDLLVENGIADSKRMSVAGGSYGGYLVSWIVSQTSRFKTSVNHAGVCDLQTQFASDFTYGRRRGIGGEPWDRVEEMDRYNPMRHCKGMKTPMLILHGELDYRVPYVQGLQLYNVYKARHGRARLVCYPDENHWILKPQNSMHWYGEVFDWLGRYLK